MTDRDVDLRDIEEAIAFLRARGFDARRRDWAMGRTIAVPWGASEGPSGITHWERIVWVVEEGSRARVECVVRLWDTLGEAGRLVEVEALVPTGPVPTVLVRPLGSDAGLVVEPGSALDGHLVEPWLDVPKRTSAAGVTHTDVFALGLVEPIGAEALVVGRHYAFIRGSARSNLKT